MVGWFGAAALALVGGLKGQGNTWRQIPLVGVLAATALFISWRVRQGREKDTPKAANVDEKTVVEVNTRVYLVYDEEKKLECSTSPSQSQPDAGGKFTGTDDLVSTELEVDFTADDSSRRSQRAKCESEHIAGEERLPKRRSVSKPDVDCKDVEEISKAETTTHGGRPSANKHSPSSSPEPKITDISVFGLLLPQMTSQTLFMPPEIASIVQQGEPYVYDLDADSLKAVTEDSLSYSPLSDIMHHEKDIIPVSDVASNRTPEDEHSTLGVSNGDLKQRTLGPMERLEKVIEVVDGDSANDGTSGESESGMHENENGIVDTSQKVRGSPEVLPPSVESFASRCSSTRTRVLPGVRMEVAPSDRGSSTFREVRATWISPEFQLNDWVSRRGDSEIEDGRLAHPSSAAETYPSPVADSIPGAFPFSCYSASESCSSDAIDTKDELLLRSPPSNVQRINPHVKDLELNSKKSSEEEYAERLRIYDEYLADPSLSPRMRSQVFRAKTTLERLLYDSD